MTGIGEDRRARPERRRRWRRPDRRSLDLGAPPASAWGHLVDLVFFRALGVGLIANEVLSKGTADWHVLVAGFWAFFMPDALRGKSSPVVRAAMRAIVDKTSSKLDDVSEGLGEDSEPDPRVTHGRDGESR